MAQAACKVRTLINIPCLPDDSRAQQRSCLGSAAHACRVDGSLWWCSPVCEQLVHLQPSALFRPISLSQGCQGLE